DAAGEVDGEIQAAHEEGNQRGDHEQGGERIPHLAGGHERIVGLMAEEFHERSLRCATAQIDRRAILRRPPYMSVSSARLPMSEVNMEVAIPSISTTAKPLIGPLPSVQSTTPAIRVVTFESKIAEKALSKPARIAAWGVPLLRTASRMRWKTSRWASTAIPTVRMMPAIPGSDSEARAKVSSAVSSTTLASSTRSATRPKVL